MRLPRPLLPAAVLLAFSASTALAMPPGAKKDLPPPPADPTPDIATNAKADPALKAAIASSARPAADTARDRFRHPYETLLFWGVKPGDTVIDLQPGGGYWTEILAPYLAKGGGTYVAGVADLSGPDIEESSRKSRAAFEAAHADKARYGVVKYVGFGPHSGPLGPAGSADVVITSREIHNWIGGGYFDKALKDIYAVLKPGGVLAVEEHRADPKPQAANASTGYVATDTVVNAALKAGFKLDGASEINANPKDDKNHPFGVWTLPPTRQSSARGGPPLTADQRAKYDAVGESDRMTLRFRKPA
jgi:predicted methyltransferase